MGEGRDGQKADAVVHAQTGSGKTLAFLLPLFASLDPSRSAVQALVVVPTRELGLQVSKVIYCRAQMPKLQMRSDLNNPKRVQRSYDMRLRVIARLFTPPPEGECSMI